MSVFNPLHSLDYCEKQVKSKDIGSYIHGLFMPREIRPFYFAVHAFRLELIQSREVIQHSTLLSTKQSWWLENLDSI